MANILSIRLFDLKRFSGVWACFMSCPHSQKRDSTTCVVVHTGVAVLSELTSLVGSSQLLHSLSLMLIQNGRLTS